MHHAECMPATSMASPFSSDFSTQVHFHDAQQGGQDRLVGKLIQQKVENKQFFYGIEITARPMARPLDYNTFGTILPLFTSIVWLGHQYASQEILTDTQAIRLAQYLQGRTVVVPHFSCYNLTDERLRHFLALPFSNVLAVRGDAVVEKQRYRHAHDLVTAIRRVRKDTISIGVAGYPEGHPEAKSSEENMQHLQQKIKDGGDFIITQVCFSAKKIIEFIEHCRANDINVPIMVGLFIPHNLKTLQVFLKLTGAHLAPADFETYKQFENDSQQFREFAVEQAWQMFNEIVESNLNVYGLQFYSANRFETVQMFLAKMEKDKII